MTGAQLWECLGGALEPDVNLPVVAIAVQRPCDEGIERVDSVWQYDGPFLAVKLLDPAIRAAIAPSAPAELSDLT